MFFVYESHLGGYYISKRKLEYAELDCDSCGDSDFFVDEFDTLQQAEDAIEELLKEDEEEWYT